jgi:hypothetical protein
MVDAGRKIGKIKPTWHYPLQHSATIGSTCLNIKQILNFAHGVRWFSKQATIIFLNRIKPTPPLVGAG